jgi:hypothetical protein
MANGLRGMGGRGGRYRAAGGGYVTETTGGGKGRTTRRVRDPKIVAREQAQFRRDTTKGQIGKKKNWIPEGEKFVAGANVFGREKRKTYDELLAEGSRADDPRNWEFHYEAPDPNKVYGPTKGMTGDERRQQAFQLARQKAEKAARLTGEDVYETRKVEYEAAGIRAETAETKAKALASGQFGSTRVARNLAAEKILAGRQTGRRIKARTTDAIEPVRKKKTAATTGVA